MDDNEIDLRSEIKQIVDEYHRLHKQTENMNLDAYVDMIMDKVQASQRELLDSLKDDFQHAMVGSSCKAELLDWVFKKQAMLFKSQLDTGKDTKNE